LVADVAREPLPEPDFFPEDEPDLALTGEPGLDPGIF
jgi:hypothetical protein